MEYSFRRSFQDLVEIDYDEIRCDVPVSSDGESVDDFHPFNIHADWYNSSSILNYIVTNRGEKRGVRALRISVETAHSPCIVLGVLKFSYNFRGLTPDVTGSHVLL